MIDSCTLRICLQRAERDVRWGCGNVLCNQKCGQDIGVEDVRELCRNVKEKFCSDAVLCLRYTVVNSSRTSYDLESSKDVLKDRARR